MSEEPKIFFEKVTTAYDDDSNEVIAERTLKVIDLECGMYILAELLDGEPVHNTLLDSKELEELAYKFLKEKCKDQYSLYKR